MATKKKKIVIGLTGPIAGGKGIVADFLKEKGFFYSSTSDRIREELNKRELEITRENLQIVADDLRKKFGPEVLAKRTWNKVIKQKNKFSVIDSIRGEAEVDFLKTKHNFYLIGITAPRKLRFQRTKERNRENDPITYRSFLEIDKADFKSGQGRFGRNIKSCLKKADIIIKNIDDLKMIRNDIERLLKEIIV